jgi:hypothetical protein
MYEAFEYLRTVVITKLPSLLLGIVVLFLGWIIANLVAKIVEKVVIRLSKKNDLSKELLEESDTSQFHNVARIATYYLVMIFVVVQFFEVLGITAFKAPFLAMINGISLAVPNLAKTVITIIGAWLIATILKSLTRKLLNHERVTGALQSMRVLNDEAKEKWASSASTVVYALVWLLFLPAILGALNLEGLTGPFEQVTTIVLAFLPRLAAAAVIMLVGYLVAKIVKGIVAHFLKGVGIDNLPQQVGMEKAMESNTLSDAIGTVIFVLILIPAAISALDTLGIEAISQPAIQMLSVVMNMVPNVAIAVLLTLVGVFLVRWVANLVTMLVEKTNLVQIVSSWGILPEERVKSEIPGLIGKTVGGILMLLILIEVFNIVYLTQISAILVAILAYVPRILVALAILLIGHLSAQFVFKSLSVVLRNTEYPVWLASAAKYGVMILAATMALEQVGVAESIVLNAFTIGFGALGLAIAIAVGLGAKDTVHKWLEVKCKFDAKDNTKEKSAS